MKRTATSPFHAYISPISAFEIVGALYFLFAACTCLLFFAHRADYFISNRGYFPITMTVISHLALVAIFVTRQIFRPSYPCFLVLWCCDVIAPVCYFCVFLGRGLNLLHEYQVTKKKYLGFTKHDLLSYISKDIGSGAMGASEVPIIRSLAIAAPNADFDEGDFDSFSEDDERSPSQHHGASHMLPFVNRMNDCCRVQAYARRFSILSTLGTDNRLAPPPPPEDRSVESLLPSLSSLSTTQFDDVMSIASSRLSSLPPSITQSSVDGVDASPPCCSEVENLGCLFRVRQVLHRIHHSFLHFVGGTHAVNILIALVLLFHLTVTFAIQCYTKAYAVLPQPRCGRCDGDWELYFNYFSFAAYIFVLSPALLYELRHVEDAFGIKNDLIYSIALASPMYLLMVLWKNATFLSYYKNIVSCTFLAMVGSSFFHWGIVMKPLIKSFRLRTLRRTALVQTAAGRAKAVSYASITFADVLNDSVLLAKFRKYTIKEFSIENIFFYEAIQEFKYLCINYKEHGFSIESSACNIYRWFFVRGCRYELNLTDGVRQRVADDVQQFRFNASMFNDAQAEIYRLMESCSFVKFMQEEMAAANSLSAKNAV